jgi:uncharacterized protein YcbK (DUF882 family)
MTFAQRRTNVCGCLLHTVVTKTPGVWGFRRLGVQPASWGKALALAAVLAVTAMTGATVDASGDTRTIWMYHIHTKETISILYKKDGKYVPEALKKLNWFLRDWRKNDATEMDPKTIDIVWEMHNELGSQQPVHIISGYRSRGTNEMLRQTRGGQASQSQHITGKAIDIHFPDIPIRQLRYSAMIRERGGVGYYPTSALPFVHVDTARVRSWPRMTHDELALLFPRGQSKYLSAEGKSLEPGDAAVARRRQPQLASQVAQFFDIRSNPRKGVLVAAAGNPALPVPPVPKPAVRPEKKAPPPSTMVAALAPPPMPRPAPRPEPQSAEPAPRLVRDPRPVERSSIFRPGPTAQERAKLNELIKLAALEPQAVPQPGPVTPPASDTRPPLPEIAEEAARLPVPAVSDTSGLGAQPASFVAAPAFDDDHPEELAYAPFPILPLLTETASADDPALARMVHPNVARTFDMIDDEGRILPMKLRPGEQTAQLLFAKEFRGQAVDLSAIDEAYAKAQAEKVSPDSQGLAERKVKTSPR